MPLHQIYFVKIYFSVNNQKKEIILDQIKQACFQNNQQLTHLKYMISVGQDIIMSKNVLVTVNRWHQSINPNLGDICRWQIEFLGYDY